MKVSAKALEAPTSIFELGKSLDANITVAITQPHTRKASCISLPFKYSHTGSMIVYLIGKKLGNGTSESLSG